jgi:hypothetical protein
MRIFWIEAAIVGVSGGCEGGSKMDRDHCIDLFG